MLRGTFDDRVLAKTVRSLNKHLAMERKTLLELLSEDKPAVRCRDNSTYRIKREELEKIGGIIPEETHGKLRLPIYIELTPDYGRGMARIHGKLDCEVVREILEKKKEETDEIFIYREEVRELRRKLPTATQYAFFSTFSFYKTKNFRITDNR
jgi:hypothetical protein